MQSVLLETVQVLTTFLTFFLMACGMPSCVRMYKTKSTKNVPFIFFLINAFCGTIGLYYGLVVGNRTFILINVVGIILWGFYILVYISITKSKRKPLTQLLASIALLFLHGMYLRLFAPLPPAQTNILGIFLFVWSLLLLLSPILEIMEIVHEGTSRGSDVAMLVGGTLCCIAWFLYGFLLGDVYVYGPNIVGLLVYTAKVITIVAYRGPTSTKIE